MKDISSDKIEEKKDHPLPVFYRRALLLSALVLAFCLLACLTLYFRLKKPANGLTAYIYQDGQLIETIDLHAVTTSYTFTIPAPDGGSNTVEVHPDTIGIIDADCPDKLCVSTGFVNSTLLPIVCLPHRLVIELKTNDQSQPDVISY
ncbi:MAG: NusG domain II-containing protein [Lachnospiraceae bacterium]|nr:NusG domain II-containing protein [Lachnospiraceae bacterium]